MIDIKLSDYNISYTFELPQIDVLPINKDAIDTFAQGAAEKVMAAMDKGGAIDYSQNLANKTDNEVAEIRAEIVKKIEEGTATKEDLAEFDDDVQNCRKNGYGIKGTDNDTVKEAMADQIASNMTENAVPDNTFVIYVKEKQKDKLESAMAQISEILGTINPDTEESALKEALLNKNPFEGFEDKSDEEMISECKKMAEEVKDYVLFGEEPTSDAAKLIASEIDSTKSSKQFGLWQALYIAMKISDRLPVPDPTGYVYAALICAVEAAYLTVTLSVSIHVSIKSIGVGISYLSLAIQNIILGTIKMRNGYAAPVPSVFFGPWNQCKAIRDSVKLMYEGSIMFSLVIGIRRTGFIIYPFISPICPKTNTNYKIGQWILLVAALIAFIVLFVCALMCNLTHNNTLWDKLLGTTFKDGDDFLAFMLSIGIKLSLLVTIVHVSDPIGLSVGVGITIPVGP